MMFRTSLLNIAAAVFLVFHCDANRDSKNDYERFVSPPSQRSSENSTDTCELCVINGGTLLGDVYPEYDHLSLGVAKGLSCSEISDLIRNSFPNESGECIFTAVLKFQEKCCWFPVPTVVCEQNVHTLVLGNDNDYNIDVEPLPINETSVKVALSFNYLALTEINTMEGTAELFMDIRMTWKDDRLAWDPKDQGGCYFTTFRASSDPEIAEIWVPPFDLGNQADSLQDLPEASATVYSNGAVDWNRFGGIKALCFFEGLDSFPYDELRCDLNFASTITVSRVEYSLIGEGLTFLEDLNITRKYQEFQLVREKADVSMALTGLPICTFYFKRASAYYRNKLIIPTILFTILSFGVFLLDQRVGERLGFGVSVVLVTVAQAILTADSVPVTNEMLWINVLTQGSQYFAIAAVMESLLVAYLYFVKVEPLVVANNTDNAHGNESTQDEFSENIQERESFISESNDPTNAPIGENHPEDATLSGDNRSEKKSEQASDTAEGCGRFTEKIPIVSKLKNFHWTASSIRMIDKVSLRLFPTAYAIFVATMYAKNPNWGK